MKKDVEENNIPYLLLKDQCYNKTRSQICGAKKILIIEEEINCMNYLVELYDWGFFPSALKIKVYEITKTWWTPFQNGILSADYMQWFKKVAHGTHCQNKSGARKYYILKMQRYYLIIWISFSDYTITCLNVCGIAMSQVLKASHK